MIKINDRSKCCGCSACVTICPKSCIRFDEDEQGFRYPIVDESLCINCGLCEKVCPCLNDLSEQQPSNVYAFINEDPKIRENSSSGGFFSIIANYVLEHNGVVFGARFNDKWEVVHDYFESSVQLDKFRRSKYSQSIIGNTFKDAQKFLKDGRLVLYTGTPCQIEGLKLYLRRDYDNLITVEVVCHAVPSPLIWREYLKSVLKHNNISLKQVSSINFRDKTTGWKRFSLTIDKLNKCILSEDSAHNIYLRGFINNLFIRPSCFDCPSKGGRSKSDFSIADFWSIKQFKSDLDDNRGVTLLYVNTPEGERVLNNLNVKLHELDSTKVLNIVYSNSTKEKYPISKFWELYNRKGLDAIEIICNKLRPNPIMSFVSRGFGYIKRKLK